MDCYRNSEQNVQQGNALYCKKIAQSELMAKHLDNSLLEIQNFSGISNDETRSLN